MSNSPKQTAGDQVAPSFSGDPHAELKTELQALLNKVELRPHLAHHYQPAIESIRAALKRNPHDDRDRVLLALESVTSISFTALIFEAQLPPGKLGHALLALIRCGLADCRPSGIRVGTKAEPALAALLAGIEAVQNRKIDRRQEQLFMLTHTPAFAPGPGCGPQSNTKAFMDALAD